MHSALGMVDCCSWENTMLVPMVPNRIGSITQFQTCEEGRQVAGLIGVERDGICDCPFLDMSMLHATQNGG